MDEEKRKLEEEKLRQEKERKEAEEKLRQEKEKREKEEKLRQEKERKEKEEKLRQEKEFKAISVANSEKIYNNRNRNNNKEISEKITIRDSELDNEELMINDSSNISKIDVINNKNKNNFIMGNNNYRNIYDKEVINKLKYELEKDLINKQKKLYNNKIISGGKNIDNEQKQKLKEIENLLKDGITNTKLNQLEEKYKNNKEILQLINSYKLKISTIDSNNINNNLTREEIIKNKLDIFKEKIYKPFWQKIENEKKNEYKRIQLLKEIKDPLTRENLETKFAIERGKVDNELTMEKERINKAIKSYEESLLQTENLSKINARPSIFYE